MRIRKGDRVVVRSGKYKGHRSDVVRTIPSTDRVVVEGVNVAKRHTKPRRATMQGGIIDKFMPLPAAAVSLWCNAHGGPARVGIEIDEQGRKTRVCRKCGAEL
ncbi:MAG TPA: 50S ribosomal protein L24 [Candidatus Acidoferrales bacterium]|nr:50S ribosomal protein L24 [Candidatus Acidoferrales bacterium]